MQQSGIVKQLNGGMALVTGERASTCGSCAGKSSCATLGAWNQRTMELMVDNGLGARVGDEVVIEVPDNLVLKSAYALYGLPMLLFFAAGITAYLLADRVEGANPDLWAALSGLAAVVGYYLSGVLKKRGEAGLEARIVRIQTQASHFETSNVEINCHIVH
jgi:sigma-E factor negative regulatory protein RseC